MKILADMGMKNKLFLVIGAKIQSETLHEPCLNDMVTFHDRYVEDQAQQDRCMNTADEDTLEHMELGELSDVDPADGSIDRPDGTNGVFLVTFADPNDSRVAILQVPSTEDCYEQGMCWIE